MPTGNAELDQLLPLLIQALMPSSNMQGGNPNMAFAPGSAGSTYPAPPPWAGPFGVLAQMSVPGLASILTGQPMQFMPFRGPGQNYFDAGYATQISGPIMTQNMAQFASMAAQGIGRDMVGIARHMGFPLDAASTALVNNMASSSWGGIGASFLYQSGLMSGIAGGNPLQGFAELYSRRDLIFSQAGTPRSYLRTAATGGLEFDPDSAFKLGQQALGLGTELYTRTYGVVGNDMGRAKAMSDALRAQDINRIDLADKVQSTFKDKGMSGVMDLLNTEEFTTGGLGKMARNAAAQYKMTQNLSFTQGFLAEDVIGRIPAVLATRNARWADETGTVQTFRGAEPKVQAGMVEQTIKTMRSVADLFQSEDMSQLMLQLDKLTSGNWTNYNPQKLQGTLRGMSAYAATLNMSSQEFANLAVNTQQGMLAATGAAFGSPTALFKASGRGMGGQATPEYADEQTRIVTLMAAMKGDLSPAGLQDALSAQTGMKSVLEGSPAGRMTRFIELNIAAGNIEKNTDAYRRWSNAVQNGAPIGELQTLGRAVYAGLGVARSERFMNNNVAMAAFTAQFSSTADETFGSVENRIQQIGTRTAINEFSQRQRETKIDSLFGLVAELSIGIGSGAPANDPRFAGGRLSGIQGYYSSLAADADKQAAAAKPGSKDAADAASRAHRLRDVAAGAASAFEAGGSTGLAAFMNSPIVKALGGEYEATKAGMMGEAEARLAVAQQGGPEAARIVGELGQLSGNIAGASEQARTAYGAARAALREGKYAEAAKQLAIAKSGVSANIADLAVHAGDASAALHVSGVEGARKYVDQLKAGLIADRMTTAATEALYGVPGMRTILKDNQRVLEIKQAYDDEATKVLQVQAAYTKKYGEVQGGFGGFMSRLAQWAAGTTDITGKTKTWDYVLGLEGVNEGATIDKDKFAAMSEAELKDWIDKNTTGTPEEKAKKLALMQAGQGAMALQGTKKAIDVFKDGEAMKKNMEEMKKMTGSDTLDPTATITRTTTVVGDDGATYELKTQVAAKDLAEDVKKKLSAKPGKGTEEVVDGKSKAKSDAAPKVSAPETIIISGNIRITGLNANGTASGEITGDGQRRVA